MQSADPFTSFPDTARLWVYATASPLSTDDMATIQERLHAFMRDWSSHGRPVKGAVHIQDRRFILVAATLVEGSISGCGIDASVHTIEEIAAAQGLQWIPALHVIYRDADGAVQHASRSAFRSLAEEGAVTADTLVFDASITTVGALRHGQFEQRAGDAWHARAFDLPQPA